jgi:preprotein translocase subunit SecG
VLATAFFLTSLGLTYFSSQKHEVAAKPLAVPAQPVVPQPVQQPVGGIDRSGAIPK